MTSPRERLASRLGFLLLSAGCAIGLGNVWRFPYITGQYGGALFVLVYLFFLLVMGLPILTMEFAVGRASRRNMGDALRQLEPKGTRCHVIGWFPLVGGYCLMMFYIPVAGWMLSYCWYMGSGELASLTPQAVGVFFDELLLSAWEMTGWSLAVLIIRRVRHGRAQRAGTGGQVYDAGPACHHAGAGCAGLDSGRSGGGHCLLSCARFRPDEGGGHS